MWRPQPLQSWLRVLLLSVSDLHVSRAAGCTGANRSLHRISAPQSLLPVQQASRRVLPLVQVSACTWLLSAVPDSSIHCALHLLQEPLYSPTLVDSLHGHMIRSLKGGQHHTLALTQVG